MGDTVYIYDDGDETIIIKINEYEIGSFGHDEYGWHGMESIIKMVHTLSETFNFGIIDRQEIV